MAMSVIWPGWARIWSSRNATASGVFALRRLVRVSRLREDIVLRCRDARGHGNIGAAYGAKIAIKQPRAQFRIAECGGNAENVQLRAAQRQRHRERVVDVVADVGIDNDQLRSGVSLRCLPVLKGAGGRAMAMARRTALHSE